MTQAGTTLIAALLDRSGSMSMIKSDTEGGFNSFIEDQRAQPGKAKVTLAQFDSEYDLVYSNVDINDVPKFTLSPRGSTALVDSLAKLIIDTGDELAKLDEDERPENVIVLVMTDGQENSSREWTAQALKSLVTEQTDKYNWQFVFLGANIDAVATGDLYGFSAQRSMTYGANSAGVDAAFATTSGLFTAMRGGNFDAGYNQSDRDAALGK